MKEAESAKNELKLLVQIKIVHWGTEGCNAVELWRKTSCNITENQN